MGRRKTLFAEGEFYHIFNRGVDKRTIFLNKKDLERFFQSMEEFNTLEPIGSIYENLFNKRLGSLASKSKKLVEFVAYCLNPNHYHFILKQISERGIERFIHRLGTGYTKYFNHKYKRSGVLFQGKFKSNHVNSNTYLLHLSAYVNLNYRVHKIPLGSQASKFKFYRSSWEEYIEAGRGRRGICRKEIILKQFQNKEEYRQFSESSLKDILLRKRLYRELEALLLE